MRASAAYHFTVDHLQGGLNRPQLLFGRAFDQTAVPFEDSQSHTKQDGTALKGHASRTMSLARSPQGLRIAAHRMLPNRHANVSHCARRWALLLPIRFSFSSIMRTDSASQPANAVSSSPAAMALR